MRAERLASLQVEKTVGWTVLMARQKAEKWVEKRVGMLGLGTVEGSAGSKGEKWEIWSARLKVAPKAA